MTNSKLEEKFNEFLSSKNNTLDLNEHEIREFLPNNDNIFPLIKYLDIDFVDSKIGNYPQIEKEDFNFNNLKFGNMDSFTKISAGRYSLAPLNCHVKMSFDYRDSNISNLYTSFKDVVIGCIYNYMCSKILSATEPKELSGNEKPDHHFFTKHNPILITTNSYEWLQKQYPDLAYTNDEWRIFGSEFVLTNIEVKDSPLLASADFEEAFKFFFSKKGYIKEEDDGISFNINMDFGIKNKDAFSIYKLV